MGESEGAQQYCLRWNNHSDSIITEFETLLGQEDFVDVTLSCDKLSLKAHKVVLSACSTYFSKLLKENPCQHPIIILRDVGYRELTAVIYFMYHGQVMVEQERIPQLLQTAKLLEVRGLCEICEEESRVPPVTEEKNIIAKTEGNHSFLAGLLGNSSVPTIKRTMSVSDSNSCSNNSNPTPPLAKRFKASSRPVPMLQSILSQQLTVPTTPTFDLTKTVGTSVKVVSNLTSKAKTNSQTNMVSNSNSSQSTLENLLGGTNPSIGRSFSGRTGNDHLISQCSNSSSDETNDMRNERLERVDSFYGETDSSGQDGTQLEPDTIMEIKEEPLRDFDDDFCDNNPTGASGDEEGLSESEAELGILSQSGRGEASLLPLLAQHLASPNLLTASASLRAAASQARYVYPISGSSVDSPLMSQVILTQPSTPPDMGPASMRIKSESTGQSNDPPRKLAFHEPRPCPICLRNYRDAATLRTHTAIMHAEGRDPFACVCGELFRTKYEMYNHKKNGHR